MSTTLDLSQEFEHAPDKIGGPSTKKLAGHTFQYSYTSGVFYRISFDEKTAYFTLPEKVNGRNYLGLPYMSRELRPNQYLVSWMVPPARAGHVSLVFDLDAKTVDCAALMPGKFELFDKADFDVMLTNGEGALYKEDPSTELEVLLKA